MFDRRSLLVCLYSLVGSLAITYVFSVPFQKRRAKQHQLKSLGAFSVAFDENGSVSSARFRHLIDPGFSEACGQLQVVDLKGAIGIRQSLQVLTREVDPIIRTTGLDRNPCVFLSRKRLCFWDSTKEGVYAKEKAIV